MLMVFATTKRPTGWQGIELLGVGGNALACDTPDMRADKLDRDHERRREKHRPQ
jgi:hypothetical protein